MGQALATATQPDHRIYLLGWGTDGDTELLPAMMPGTLKELLTRTKAQVRCMFWAHPGGAAVPPGSGGNGVIAAHLNSLPHAAAILDAKLPDPQLNVGWVLKLLGLRPGTGGGGIHHQKLLVVRGRLGLIAFVGGMDVHPNRTETNNVGEPLHDVHLRVAGEAGVTLLRTFRDRWLDHPAAAELDLRKFGMDRARVKADFAAARAMDAGSARSLPSSTGTTGKESMAVAVGRTFADLTKLTGKKLSYDFAPYGETTAWDLVEAGVKAAREYIYIEDQYFVSRRLTSLLVDKLRQEQFKFLLMLILDSRTIENKPDLIKVEPNGTITVPNEVPYGIAARNDIRRALASVDPKRSRWRMFRLTPISDPARRAVSGSYVHSKLMIFDDEYAIVGTANANDRGYTFDTELVAGITDDLVGRTTGQRFARDLRVNLWHKHLGVLHGQLVSWDRALPLWLRPPRTAMITDTSDLEDSPMLGARPSLVTRPEVNEVWSRAIDPDGDKLP
ncbi:MAG: phospholipase D-like domain-containing protein [Micromonosporaceae bacterium]